jgi:hypothetical protein
MQVTTSPMLNWRITPPPELKDLRQPLFVVAAQDSARSATKGRKKWIIMVYGSLLQRVEGNKERQVGPGG